MGGGITNNGKERLSETTGLKGWRKDQDTEAPAW